MNKIKCPHCEKEYSVKGLGTHIWRSHGEGANFTANNQNRIAWNKGKTKETDERVEKYANKIKNTPSHFKNKKHSEESKQKMREAYLIRKSEGRAQTWTSRNIRSYPELFFEGVLFNNNLIEHCSIEHPIKAPKKTYLLDFYFPEKKIDLEIDGQQHRFRQDEDFERDEFLKGEGITVYRIPWKSINDDLGKQYITEEIQKFLEFYDAMKQNDLNKYNN